MSKESEREQNVKLQEEIANLKQEMADLRVSTNERIEETHEKQRIEEAKRRIDNKYGEKNIALAYVLWLLLGGLGFHRLYLGSAAGWLQFMLTIVAVVLFFVVSDAPFFLIAAVPLGVWLLADLLLIPGLGDD